jgi:UDP-N-acetylglucosamine 2-epimerase (non-hydrolysing)
MIPKRHKNIAVILGTRPNFVKAAPFFRQAKNHPEFKITLIHTGQHFDANMSKIFFDEMQIPKPDVQLDVKGEFHTEKIGKMFNALKHVLKSDNFDAVVLFGDVNSTLAGAIAAISNQYKIIHIEAGLRSHDRRMPEEINRAIVDHLSHILFTTEPSANENLLREGVDKSKIRYVGNIMIESLIMFRDNIDKSDILQRLQIQPKEYTLVTIHRQENTDSAQSMKIILEILQRVNKQTSILIPLHPGTQQKIIEYRLEDLLTGLNIIEPLGYFDFVKLMAESKGVITDSGGIQEETTHLGVPCCTLRYNTERPITIERGTNKLFTMDLDEAEAMVKHIHTGASQAVEIPLWDDSVSRRIFKCLK